MNNPNNDLSNKINNLFIRADGSYGIIHNNNMNINENNSMNNNENNSMNNNENNSMNNNENNSINNNENNSMNNDENNSMNNDENNSMNNDKKHDIWDTVINDDKFYINNKISRIFPILKNFNNFSKIKIDNDSFSYITIREIAEIISKIICYHLLEYNLNPQKSIIVDYTAGVGGNVLSFGKFFKYIYAIELDEIRAKYLENNINVYGYKNINVINKCALEFNDNDLITLNPNIIFVDPPWGGTNYKNNENLMLSLGTKRLEELVIDIVKKYSEYYTEIVNKNPKEKNNNYNNKFIILKLPKNYNIEYFYYYIKSNNHFLNYNICLYLYILNKMIIVVCELQYKFYL